MYTKNEFPQGNNYLRSLIQTAITIQRPFELTDIEYDMIKYEIARMVNVYYNTAIVQNVINEYDK